MSKQKNRQKLRYAQARQRLAQSHDYTPAVASQFIPHFPLHSGDKITLYCRSSTPKQVRDENLDNQMVMAIRRLRRHGIQDLAIFDGQETSSIYAARPVLEQAIKNARSERRILIAVDRSRLLRHCEFDGRDKTEQPDADEYEVLLRKLDGVRFTTLDHPDAKTRGKQTKRAMEARGKKGGRPKRVRRGPYRPGPEMCRRYRDVDEARRAGHTIKEIAAMLGIPFETVRSRLRRLKKGFDWPNPN